METDSVPDLNQLKDLGRSNAAVFIVFHYYSHIANTIITTQTMSHCSS